MRAEGQRKHSSLIPHPSSLRAMRTESESHEILDRALHAADATEADACFVWVDHDISRFAGSNVHQNMSEESGWLMLRVIDDGAMGVASTSSFDDEEIARTATLAREAARHSDRLQNFSGLYAAHEPAPQLRTSDERTANLSPIDKAHALRAMFDR